MNPEALNEIRFTPTVIDRQYKCSNLLPLQSAGSIFLFNDTL